MKGRSSLTLLIVILLLGAFIWLQEVWRARSSIKAYEDRRLFELDALSLVSLQFVQSNVVVDCVKEGGEWLAGSPGTGMGRADVALVQQLVDNLGSMGKGTTISSRQLEIRGFDASEYGFDHPSAEIIAIDNQGRHHWLIGRKAPLDEMVYAKSADGKNIYTLPGKLLQIIPADPDQLRDRVLFSGEAVGVRRIEIRGKKFIQLLKDIQTGWNLQQPVSAPADPHEVEKLIQNLYRFRIDDFVADDVSDWAIYGLQGEVRQISVGSADGTSRMLILGDEIPGRSGFLYGRRADDTTVFALSTNVLEVVNIKPKKLRDAGVLTIEPGKVDSVSIAKGSRRVELVLDDSGMWNTVVPVEWPADKQAVGQMLSKWGDAVVFDFEAGTNSTTTAEWVLEFGSEELGRTNRIEVLSVADAKGGLMIRRDGDPAMFQINISEIEDFVVDPLTYKDKRIWDLRLGDISRVSMSKSGRSPQVIARSDGGEGFSVVGTNGAVQVDEAATRKLLAQLASARTPEYLVYNPRELEIYGLTNPFLELQIGLSGTNELGRVLLVGRETPNGFYSMIKGRDVVFYLDKTVVDALSTNLLVAPAAIANDGE